MQEPTYRCPACSTRSTVVMVPEDERTKHEATHTTTTPTHLCDECGVQPSGHGHFGFYCEPCSQLPYAGGITGKGVTQ